MPLRQSMQRLAGDELLCNLSLERGAVGTMLGHGFHPLKAQHRWSIPNPLPVHPQGRTPAYVLPSILLAVALGQFCTKEGQGLKQIVPNAVAFADGTTSIRQAYADQQGWPGRHPWGDR